jgi:hypothetical protein
LNSLGDFYVWQHYLRRFAIDHWYCFAKQRLHWILPQLSTPEQSVACFPKGTLERLDALQHYEQALAIYQELKLNHMVEQCQIAISDLNQAHSQPSTCPPLRWWQNGWLWFGVGLAIALLIWWLR